MDTTLCSNLFHGLRTEPALSADVHQSNSELDTRQSVVNRFSVIPSSRLGSFCKMTFVVIGLSALCVLVLVVSGAPQQQEQPLKTRSESKKYDISFYNPDTNRTYQYPVVTFGGQDDDNTRQEGGNGNACSCQYLQCGCCMGMNIQQLNFSQICEF